MRYDAALKYVYALERRGIKLELDSLGRGLGRLGHPERHLRFVHVAGTNGKGSVSAMVASCLRAAGFRTGLFTSPHLHRWVERIQINGRPLSKTAAAAAISEVAEAFDAPRAPVLSFFETTFAAALVAFRNAETDIVVLETGLGGRLDATNVVVPEVSVITGVALDHQRYLGPTLARIALEKAGILKRGVPAISGVRDRSARAVVRTEAKRRRCPLKELDSDFGADGIADLWCGAHTLTDVELGLPGEHQHSNAALAYATLLELRAHGFDVPDRAIRHGLRAVRWPCRLEWLEGRPRVLLDAAHNPEGARALAKYLGEHRAP
ncbi:MAG: bifunctional folylpolyglutamate synthase/dihydrofolate synthase, partial [Myxococcales bacterium]|nr:bifunctional folylpolyglutamate synthase/dihydrofolate synthase [Myxococcales bacterium]